MTKNYDLAIIGGSFAGLFCAKSASARGLKTFLFDKKSQPMHLLRVQAYL